MRIGQGYDVHRLVEGRKCILCGVEIPYEKGLLGHSDADVALHALADALLGAAALGDIGQLFPDTDPSYEGADSRILLREVNKIIKQKGFYTVNADLTIIAQKPKMMPYINKMRRNIADDLETNEDNISVKATTTEKLGFEGRGEGISAMAVVLIDNK
jgi:2-C-methyl-D-erythritol 2,4-cyclodiphosphate synthase